MLPGTRYVCIRVPSFVRSWYLHLRVTELFFVRRVLRSGLLSKRYVPPSEGKSCTYIRFCYLEYLYNYVSSTITSLSMNAAMR